MRRVMNDLLNCEMISCSYALVRLKCLHDARILSQVAAPNALSLNYLHGTQKGWLQDCVGNATSSEQ